MAAAVGHEVLLSKKAHLGLSRFHAGEVQSEGSECKATTRQLDATVAKVEELELAVGLPADEAGKAGEMQR